MLGKVGSLEVEDSIILVVGIGLWVRISKSLSSKLRGPNSNPRLLGGRFNFTVEISILITYL